MKTLELEVDRKSDWRVLTVRGEIDVTTTPRVRAQLISLLSEGKPNVIVDLEGVDFLDSSGLGALVAALKLARSRSGELRIVCDQQRSVRKVLEVTGLERVLDRYDTVAAAAAA
ncbi:MAG: STAS domain-containing protein [Acidimicrobiia bacterium]|nr:STAS domain-containing protein [Acidimicrobiia bacterium]MBV9042950.1 STAS domain-containing protein [Acidimicrobiia bacterium]